jgi:hypothetical protein
MVRRQATGTATEGLGGGAAGRRTLTDGMVRREGVSPGQSGAGSLFGGGLVQRKLSLTVSGPASGEEVARHAAAGVEGATERLPFLEPIQAAFGRHDLGDVSAHRDAPAGAAAEAIGAEAYAVGRHVAFAGPPTLHTAAHEAAHVVQQRAGVHCSGGVGAVGDVHEQHADAVADLVVSGRSAESLLDGYVGGGGAAVQRKVNLVLGAATVSITDQNVASYATQIKQAATAKSLDPERVYAKVKEWAEDEWGDHPESGDYHGWEALVTAAAQAAGADAAVAEEKPASLATVAKQVSAQYEPSTYDVAPTGDVAQDPRQTLGSMKRLWRALQTLQIEGAYSQKIDQLIHKGFELLGQLGAFLKTFRVLSNTVELPSASRGSKEKASVLDKVMYNIYQRPYLEMLGAAAAEELGKSKPATYHCHQNAASDVLKLIDVFEQAFSD